MKPAIQEQFENYRRLALVLADETGIKYDAKPVKDTVRVMLDGYCKALDEGDEHLKDLFIAGLMLRFWDRIKKLALKSPGFGNDLMEFHDWLYEAISYAVKYRKWQKDTKVNAQQCISQCIETIRQQHHYEANLDKHRSNFNTVSLETPLDEEGKTTLLDTMTEDDADSTGLYSAETSARDIVQMCINSQMVIEAIIFDTIAFGDSLKQKKITHKQIDEDGTEYKYTTTTSEFWAFRCVQALSKLPENYFKYFMENYKVKPEILNAAIDSIRHSTNQKLYKSIEKAQKFAQSKLANY